MGKRATRSAYEIPNISSPMPTKLSPFALVYGAKAALLIEQAIITSETKRYRVDQNKDLLRAKLDLLEEESLEAVIRNV